MDNKVLFVTGHPSFDDPVSLTNRIVSSTFRSLGSRLAIAPELRSSDVSRQWTQSPHRASYDEVPFVSGLLAKLATSGEEPHVLCMKLVKRRFWFGYRLVVVDSKPISQWRQRN